MSKINALCVYCGSNPGTDAAFVKAAHDFGKILAENTIRLVYGGGSIGLMGALAASAIEHGGEVTGIIPEFLTAAERPRRLAQELIITRDMHERKRTMFERAEQMTWAQLGRHKKPILVANINGFWDPLLGLITHMRALALVPSAAQGVHLLVADRIEDILPKLREAARAVVAAEKKMAVPADRM
jgi:predicted Rossmann-fold nucleotide-binding protein